MENRATATTGEPANTFFMWDAEKEASDPPFSPCTSFQHTAAPSPAVRAEKGRVFFPAPLPHPLPKAIWASDLPVHHPVHK